MSGQWYSNKDLYEMMQQLGRDLQATTDAVRKYNGIWEKLSDCQKRITAIEYKTAGKNVVWEGMRNWGGWIIALVALAYKFIGG